MRREEFGDLVVIKSQSRRPPSQCIRGNVHPAAYDAGFHLDGTIAPVTQSRKDAIQISHEEKRNGRIAAQVLVQYQMSGLLVKVTPFQKHESPAVPVEVVGTGRESLHSIGNQVDVVKLGIRR